MKTTKNSRLARILVVAMVVCMLACTMLAAPAMAANEAVNNCRNGVLQVKMIYTFDDKTIDEVNSGTGFLINDNTLLTCYHVVALSTADIDAMAAEVGKTSAEFQSRLSIAVTVSRDVTVPATIVNYSEEMDFAILRLSQSLQGKATLPIRSSKTVRQTEQVYSIGFPITPAGEQSYNTYTSEDATVTEGVVNKVGVGENILSGKNTEYIMTSCNLDYGNSGGPMVDVEGNVIGISQGFSRDTATDFYRAITIDQVTEVLGALGIAYTEADIVVDNPTEPTDAPTEPAEQPTDAPTQAPTQAPSEMPTLPTTGNSGTKDSGSSMTWILIAAAVAVAVIIIVVVVILLGGKKQSAPVPGAGVYTPPAPPVRPAPPAGGFAPAPTAPAQGAGETTVLSGGAGETTVLSRNAVNGGTLIRKRNGETIAINSDNFVIGRERKSVNYCIADNSSVSRTHVKLSVRGGVTYLTDLGAANGTFVNGVKAMPRQEIALKNGDKITLADEDLEYKN